MTPEMLAQYNRDCVLADSIGRARPEIWQYAKRGTEMSKRHPLISQEVWDMCDLDGEEFNRICYAYRTEQRPGIEARRFEEIIEWIRRRDDLKSKHFVSDAPGFR
jgi:hypothetical protein